MIYPHFAMNSLATNGVMTMTKIYAISFIDHVFTPINHLSDESMKVWASSRDIQRYEFVERKQKCGRVRFLDVNNVQGVDKLIKSLRSECSER